MKPWLDWSEQVDLLRERGLVIADEDACLDLLQTSNYYRWSGYARYFQVAPHEGNNQFAPNTTFDHITSLLAADRDLRNMLVDPLGQVEILLRTRYAFLLAKHQHGYSDYMDDSFYSGASTSESISDAIHKDLDRSRESHIERYRDRNAYPRYGELPIWSAVEAFSFGTLSKSIERANQGAVAAQLADDLELPRVGFASRVKALVYLRNRCAHHGRLWNHSVIDAGSTPNNVRKKAKKKVGQFQPRSVMEAIASLDDLLARTGLRRGLLTDVQEHRHLPDYWRGLLDPKPTRSRKRTSVSAP